LRRPDIKRRAIDVTDKYVLRANAKLIAFKAQWNASVTAPTRLVEQEGPMLLLQLS
jgi:hypothetical protein